MKKYILILSAVTLLSCKKYLDAKQDMSLATPTSLADLQAIMDYSTVMYIAPYSDEASADNFYLTTSTYNTLPAGQPGMYTWSNGFIFSGNNSDWGLAYKKIYYCNTVLDALPGIQAEAADATTKANLMGQALFVRAVAFFSVLNIWSKPFDANTAATDPGIPIRLDADFNKPSVRISIQQSYDQIIADLKTSATQLPLNPVSNYRASRPAAYAMLSRVYLSLHDYANSGKYADSCLQYSNTLLDYNSFDSTQAFPFKPINKETIYYTLSGNTILNSANARIDSVLYNSYGKNDLRHGLFFAPNAAGYVSFKGTYSASSTLFSGLATDEVYLTRAECFARAGNTPAALNTLNTLMITRFKTGSFLPFTAATPAEALNIILQERRKELVMRFVRWMDVRRLNKEGANIVLRRIVNNQSYILDPNSNRYALPLPEDILILTGMAQNSY